MNKRKIDTLLAYKQDWCILLIIIILIFILLEQVIHVSVRKQMYREETKYNEVTIKSINLQQRDVPYKVAEEEKLLVPEHGS